MRAKTESAQFLGKLIPKTQSPTILSSEKFLVYFGQQFPRNLTLSVLACIWSKNYQSTYLSRINESWHAVETFSAQNLMLNLNLGKKSHVIFSSHAPFKAKIGSIRTKNRNDPLNKCTLCGTENETPKHMFECDKYPGKNIYDVIYIEPIIQDIWYWIFHSDRHNLDRMRISHWVHNQWKIRARLLEEEGIHNIPGTGGQGQQGAMDQGVMDPETNNTLLLPMRHVQKFILEEAHQKVQE